jgi:hypothetical protein
MTSASLAPQWLLSELEWQKIAKPAGLDAAARQRIENAVATYRYSKNAKLRKPLPAAVKKRLKRAADAAIAYVLALTALGEEEKFKLQHVDDDGMYGLRKDGNVDGVLSAAVRQAEFLVDLCTTTEGQIARGRRSARLLHDFVRELDAILFKFSGKHIKRSNAPEQFVHAACKIADRELGPGSIEEAMKAVIAGRGEKPRLSGA